MRRVVREVRPQRPLSAVAETIVLRAQIAAEQRKTDEILHGQARQALASIEYQRRFERRLAESRITAAEALVKRVMESQPAMANPPAFNEEAVVEMIAAVLHGEADGTAGMSQQERVTFATRQLRQLFSGKGASPAAGAGHCDNSAHARAGAAPFNLHQPH